MEVDWDYAIITGGVVGMLFTLLANLMNPYGVGGYLIAAFAFGFACGFVARIVYDKLSLDDVVIPE